MSNEVRYPVTGLIVRYNCRYADVDEYLCKRVLVAEGCEMVDWTVEIAAAHKVRVATI